MSASSVFKDAFYRSRTSRAIIALVEINHDDLATPLRFTSDSVNTTHNGNTYLPFPFEVALPTNDPDQPPSTVLQIDNVDRQIAETIRALDSPPNFIVTLVLDDDTDRAEAGPFTMQLVNARYGPLVAQADIRSVSLSEEPYPVDTYNPDDYPGLPLS